MLMEHFKCLPSELDKEENSKLMRFLYIRDVIAAEKAKDTRRDIKHSKHGRR